MKSAIAMLNFKRDGAKTFRDIVDEFTDSILSLSEEPLDGDEVEAIVNLVRDQLNRKEGNW